MADTAAAGFDDAYGAVLVARPLAREDAEHPPERALQRLWFDQALPAGPLATREGHRLRVVSPGWWNDGPGPDFRGAQIEFNGVLHVGDVEAHLDAGGWHAHGHGADPRYNDVILHVVLRAGAGGRPARTAAGRVVPTLLVGPLDASLIAEHAGDAGPDGYPAASLQARGRCAGLIPAQGTGPLADMLDLAGDWRLLAKARAFGGRMARVGPDQALYEAVFAACGYSAFKAPFLALARELPYERARQLARQDPLLLEAALLHLAGLLPLDFPGDPPPHYTRLANARASGLPGLRALPFTWPRGGVRPANYPERRLGGLARLIARTATDGLWDSVAAPWRGEARPTARRRDFEALFPGAMGFWATRCVWHGDGFARPSAPIGADRVRAIIGNVFVPAALADARHRRDRALEAKVHAFLDALPAEPGNHVVKRMLPRLLGGAKAPRIGFRRQQGILQMHQDWCEPNPACENCAMYRQLDRSR